MNAVRSHPRKAKSTMNQVINLFHASKTLRWVIVIFLLAIATGCGNKDSAIESLKSRNITISADNLGAFAGQGDLATVKLLIDAGVDVNAKNSQGGNALTDACWSGRQDVVSYLLDAKADLGSASAGHITPLSAAVNQKHAAIALILLDRGANPNTVDPTGSTPLIEASWQGSLPLVKALLAKGANANYKRPDNGFTALKATGNTPEIALLLKAAGATE